MSELVLITGKKGHGKTLWTVDQAFKLYDQGKFEHYYSDIDGLKHKGFLPVDDWRDCENNSLIILDEVQFKKVFNRLGGKFDMQIIELTTMRKRGITIWLITQRARLLNPDVLALVDKHIHIERNGQKTSRVYEFSDAEMNITKSKKLFANDKYVYTHNEEVYAFYKSIQEGSKHYKKSYINKGVVSTVITLVLALGFAGYYVYNVFSSGAKISGGGSTETVQNVKPNNQNNPNANNSQANQQAVQAVLKPADMEYCKTSFKWTEAECNKYYRPQPVSTGSSAMTMTNDSTGGMNHVVNYDPNKPYDVVVASNAQVKTYPKFSGCAELQGKFYSLTQQGTRLEVSKQDCQRLLANSTDRPFDYYRDTESNSMGMMKEQKQPIIETKSLTNEDLAKFQMAREMGLI